MSTQRKPIKITTRKRKRSKAGHQSNDRVNRASAPASAISSSIPSILSKIPLELSSRHDNAIVDENTGEKATGQTARDENTLGTSMDSFIDDAELELPSDMILAMESLKRRYSCGTCDMMNASSQPITFVTRSILNSALRVSSIDEQTDQIASSLASTGFDVELKRLCTNGEIKLIQLQGLNGEEDVAVFPMSEYCRGVQDVLMNLSSSTFSTTTTVSIEQQQAKVVSLFLSCIKDFTNTFVLGQELERAMQRRNRKSKEYILNEDRWINDLINAQLLLPRRQLSGSMSASNQYASYWLTLPKLGQAASLIAEGRRRMVMKLKRAPNRELKRNHLETNARGGMAGPFHVRDLLARGIVKIISTANGQFIRLVRDT